MRALLVIAIACVLALPVRAADIKVLSGNGAKAAVRELCAQFERASGHKVAIRFEVNAPLKRKIEAGESFDVAVLNPPVLDDLIRQGRIDAATRAISSVAAFKRALLDANSVAYPAEGASGVYFVGLLERMGIATEMKAKLRPMPGEDTVEVVARGEADMVVVVAPRIFDAAGVEFAGLIAPELQT